MIFFAVFAVIYAQTLCEKHRTGHIGVVEPTNMTITWTHDCAAKRTTFLMESHEATRWMGVGFVNLGRFSAKSHMKDADVMQFSIDANGTFSYRNALATNGNQEPVSPGLSSFDRIPAAWIHESSLFVSFERNWTIDDAHADLTKDVRVLFARGKSPDLTAFHGRWGAALVPGVRNLFNASAPLPNTCGANPTGGVGGWRVFSQNLTWVHNCSAETTTFTLRGPSDNGTWIGAGFVDAERFDTKQAMRGADLYLFGVDPSGTVLQRNGLGIHGNHQPVTANVSQILPGSVHVTVQDGTMVATFSRKWDPVSKHHVSLRKELRFLLAHGPQRDVSSFHHANAEVVDGVRSLFAPSPPLSPAGGPPTTPSMELAPTTAPSHQDPCDERASIRNHFSLPLGDTEMDIQYLINCKDHTILFNVTANTTGWFGLGFNAARTMNGADVYQMTVTDDGRAVVRNGLAANFTVDASDERERNRNFLTAPVGHRHGSKMSVSFSRRWNTTMPSQANLTYHRPLYVIASRRTRDANMDAVHIVGPSGLVMSKEPMQLFSTGNIGPETVDTETLRLMQSVHGGMMLLAWLVLAPLGVFVACFLKPLGHLWYIIHRGAMVSVVVLSLLGFGVAFYATDAVGREHFTSVGNNPHAVIGAVVLLLMGLQTFLGVYANQRYNEHRLGVPIWPDQIHHWLGRLTLLAAMTSAFFGVALLSNAYVNLALVFFAWLVATVIALPLFAFAFGLHKKARCDKVVDERSSLLSVDGVDKYTSDLMRALLNAQTDESASHKVMRSWLNVTYFIAFGSAVVVLILIKVAHDQILI